MRARVVKNIGKKSENTFGKPGTILHFKRMPEDYKTEFYINDQRMFCVHGWIHTPEELNHYVGGLHQDYYTLFKRIEGDIGDES